MKAELSVVVAAASSPRRFRSAARDPRWNASNTRSRTWGPGAASSSMRRTDPAAEAAAKAAFAADRRARRGAERLPRLQRADAGVAGSQAVPPVPVSDDLFRVLRAAQQMARASDGAFDVTGGPVESAVAAGAPPAGAARCGRASRPRGRWSGRTKLELDEARRTVRLRRPGMQLDLGGIAKGFAADEAAARAAPSRHRQRARGRRRRHRRRGRRRPARTAGGSRSPRIEGADRPPAGYLTLRDAAVSTSGDAEQFMVVGRRPPFAHLRSPHRAGADRPEQRTVVAAKGRRRMRWRQRCR